MRKKTGVGVKIIIGIVSIILIIAIGAGVFAYYNLNKVERKDISQDLEQADLPEIKKEKEILNIALFGFDGSYKRLDSIMVASIDKKYKKVKLTSLLRDMYLEMPGYEPGLLNHAFLIGGPELAIKAINTNFGLDVEDYIAVNMDGFVKIVDSIGGVEAKISKEEIPLVNAGAKSYSDNEKQITSPGVKKLSGAQALAYARIRKIDSDFTRTARQREILNSVFKTAKNQGGLKLIGTISSILPYVETTLSNNEIFNLATTAVLFDVNSIEEFRIPVNGLYKNEKINDWFALRVDVEANKKKLHEFIYGIE